MISEAITYGEKSSVLVDEYNHELNKDHKYWNDRILDATRKEIKQHYIVQQEHLCCYCGLPDSAIHGSDWDAEHVVPKALHPNYMFTPQNLAVACTECNSAKRSKETMVTPNDVAYPAKSEDFLVVHPHFDEWSEHILRDDTTYASYSEKGKWTIKECELNRFAGRVIGLRYPISDSRFEQEVKMLLASGVPLKDALDRITSKT